MEGLIFFFLLLQGCVFGFFCSYIAGQKGRDNGSWFVLGFFFSFIALIAIGVVPSLESQTPKVGTRKCPNCAEEVKSEAKICRFCQATLPALVSMTDEQIVETYGEVNPPELVGMTELQLMEKYKIIVENDLFVYRNRKKKIFKRFYKLDEAVRFSVYCDKQ